MDRYRTAHPPVLILPFVCVALAAIAARAVAQPAPDPLATLDATMAAAEVALRQGELQIAESRYRSALMEGWMVLGGVDAADRRPADARAAFRRASSAAVDATEALRWLAVVELQDGKPAEAVTILARLAGHDARDVTTRRLLAQALVAAGQPEEAVQELQEAHAAAPEDLELAFALASGYLRIKRIDAAARLFEEVKRSRPTPQTDVLIGRTYRDAGEYGRARAALEAALTADPRARRAHYYLATVALMEQGAIRLDEAIGHLTSELTLAPADPVVNARLGMALVEAHREADALPALQIASRWESASADTFYYLGRSQLALERPADAAAALRRALELSQAPGAGDSGRARVDNIHYLLAVALRGAGKADEAAAHFAQAEGLSVARAETARDRLTRYLADAPDPQAASLSLSIAAVDARRLAPFAAMSPAQRADVRRRVPPALARAYLNLGIMHVQAGRFLRAAELFEQCAGVDPAFPQVQYSLGVAYFNARRYDKAAPPLARVLDADPGQAIVRRMLGVASLHTGAFDKAAALLADDPQRASDPSLQYAYGVALVRSGRAADAEAIFSRLLAGHADIPELSVVLGHAYAQQGNFDAAIESLRRAVQLKPDVAEAQSALGVIFLKQGKLAEAEAALRAELTAHPEDAKARQTLATVLDLAARPDEALAQSRLVVKATPEAADARYLLGKILLARGATDEAAEHLEAAVRLAPEDANIHYQLAQAYRKLGRTDAAQKEFETYQRIKDKLRGSPK